MKSALSMETQLLDGEILAVVLDGSLNTTTTSQFDQAIQSHLDHARTKIIIDCRNVDYISSIGLGSLIALQARLRKKGGEVKLAALHGVAAEAIRLVGLDKLLNIYGDLESASQSFYPAGRQVEDSSRPNHLGRLESRLSFASVAGDDEFLRMERWACEKGGPRRTAIGVMRYFRSLGWTPEQIAETNLGRLAALLPPEPLGPQLITITVRELRIALRVSEEELTKRFESGEIRHASNDGNVTTTTIDLRDFCDRERTSILQTLGLE